MLCWDGGESNTTFSWLPPPRNFFCDARNVGAEATVIEPTARGEAVRCTDGKDVAFRDLGLGTIAQRR